MRAVYVTLRLPLNDPTATDEDALLLGELIEAVSTSIVDLESREVVKREPNPLQAWVAEKGLPVGELVGAEMIEEVG